MVMQLDLALEGLLPLLVCWLLFLSLILASKVVVGLCSFLLEHCMVMLLVLLRPFKLG